MRLLLLPGLDGTGRLFAPLRRALPGDWSTEVVAYPPDRPLGYDELLPRVRSAAEGMGLGDRAPWVVVAESFSGPLAVRLAAAQPAGLRGVVLCVSFVRSPVSAMLRPARRIVGPWLFRDPFNRLGKRVLMGRYDDPDVTRLLIEATAGVSPAVLATRVRAAMTVDASAALRQCPVPVLYIRGTHDWLIHRSAWEHVHALRPDARLIEIEGPHLLMEMFPQEVASAIESFCKAVTA